MKRRAPFGLMVIVGLIVGSAACGEHDNAVTGPDQTTTTTRVERTTLDGIIDDIAYSQDVLTRTRGLNAGRTIVQMQVTSRDLKAAESHLSRPDLGVPPSTVGAMREAITAMDSALEDAMQCLMTHIAASACEPTVSVVRDRAAVVGEELASLIPYGTRSARRASEGDRTARRRATGFSPVGVIGARAGGSDADSH